MVELRRSMLRMKLTHEQRKELQSIFQRLYVNQRILNEETHKVMNKLTEFKEVTDKLEDQSYEIS